MLNSATTDIASKENVLQKIAKSQAGLLFLPFIFALYS